MQGTSIRRVSLTSLLAASMLAAVLLGGPLPALAVDGEGLLAATGGETESVQSVEATPTAEAAATPGAESSEVAAKEYAAQPEADSADTLAAKEESLSTEGEASKSDGLADSDDTGAVDSADDASEEEAVSSSSAETEGETSAVSAGAAVAEPAESDVAVLADAEETASVAALAGASTDSMKSTDEVAVYRLYNPNSGEHFFTSNSYEATYLQSLGWRGESVSWFAPSSSSRNVYRLYNSNNGDHHYTMDKKERDYLIKIGWSDEGIGFISDESQATPVYRLYNPNSWIAYHHYTTSVTEYEWLYSLGWRKEGIGWYGAAMPSDGWYTTGQGDEVVILGGKAESDTVATNPGGNERYITAAGYVLKNASLQSPSSSTRYTADADGNISNNSGLSYSWLGSSPYWSGNVKVKLLNKHFNEGRGGKSITKIVIHHNAGNLTTETCYATWQTRSASAHYQVEADGTVGQLVLDSDTAWHAGNWNVNQQSIGIEHADYLSNGSWVMTEATLDAGARLVAALCLTYKLGRPEWGINVIGHNECSSTACPASLAVGGSQHNLYVAKMQSWYDRLSKL